MRVCFSSFASVACVYDFDSLTIMSVCLYASTAVLLPIHINLQNHDKKKSFSILVASRTIKSFGIRTDQFPPSTKFDLASSNDQETFMWMRLVY